MQQEHQRINPATTTCVFFRPHLYWATSWLMLMFDFRIYQVGSHRWRESTAVTCLQRLAREGFSSPLTIFVCLCTTVGIRGPPLESRHLLLYNAEESGRVTVPPDPSGRKAATTPTRTTAAHLRHLLGPPASVREKLYRGRDDGEGLESSCRREPLSCGAPLPRWLLWPLLLTTLRFRR